MLLLLEVEDFFVDVEDSPDFGSETSRTFLGPLLSLLLVDADEDGGDGRDGSLF